ncbi:MAG TPA: protoporphyrinogen oxidase [Verrucomicrobiae bacterium]|nr:protoporphyrinogen oxidase [Verrucomicrobiae bacterium]
MADQPRVVVVGAGISGLSCAYRLHRLKIPCVVLEASDRPGGLAGTVERDGFLFETGPQSFQGTDSLLGLIQELDIEGELLRADPRAPRYILQNHRLKQIPMSPQSLLLSSLLSPGSRWKVASEPFRRTRPPGHDESVADFVRRKFGHEILEYLVSPFVSGVYAGDPEQLSLKAAFPSLEEWEREYGSVLRGAMKSRGPKTERKGPPPLCSFRHGVATLSRALAKSLGESAKMGAPVRSLRRTSEPGHGAYEIGTETLGRTETLRAPAVVLGTPAYISSQLLGSVSSRMGITLSGIAYAPVAVVAAAYSRAQISNALDGFGFLVPRKEKVRILGTIWNSSLFPGRAPQDKVVMTTFLGGATDRDIAGKARDEIAAAAHEENSKILGIQGSAISSEVFAYPKALPQYNLGHGHIIENLRAGQQETPGIFFAGNYLEGPSMGKCVEQGFATAEAVRAFLSPAGAAPISSL